jgi:hypothetical protein
MDVLLQYNDLNVMAMLSNLQSSVTTAHVRWVPCEHGTVRPQVADGEKASRYGDSNEYIE